MIQNGLPNHDGSASNHSISGMGTSVWSASACITWYCDSKFASRNTRYSSGAMRTTRGRVRSTPAGSAQVPSNITVSFDQPVALGISRRSTATPASPATSESQEVS